jgi:hypothetical protein
VVYFPICRTYLYGTDFLFFWIQFYFILLVSGVSLSVPVHTAVTLFVKWSEVSLSVTCIYPYYFISLVIWGVLVSLWYIPLSLYLSNSLGCLCQPPVHTTVTLSHRDIKFDQTDCEEWLFIRKVTTHLPLRKVVDLKYETYGVTAVCTGTDKDTPDTSKMKWQEYVYIGDWQRHIRLLDKWSDSGRWRGLTKHPRPRDKLSDSGLYRWLTKHLRPLDK